MDFELVSEKISQQGFRLKIYGFVVQ